jgi:CubicO group peptidase (beta-lactamase class C family)
MLLRALPLLLAVLGSLPHATAQDAARAAGSWHGAIDVPGQKLKVHVVLARAASGAFSGTIDIPAQHAEGLPLENITFSGNQVTFAIAKVPGDPTFAGSLNAAADAIEGTFTQGGQELAFALRREDSKAAADQALAGFDDWLESTRRAWQVPGVAVAVVKGNDLVHTAASGLRDVDQKLPVTPDTLFAIGSSTKAFTTFVLGTLVDEGRLQWDEPVRKWMPEFRLQDEAIAAALTPRDLVTHRSGLPRHDLLWYNAEVTRADLVRRLAFLPASKGLRTDFQYNNLMFLTAGYLAERITGKSWEDLVRQRVFAPLGMTRSNFAVGDSQQDADHALPYRKDDGSVHRIPFRDITAVGPAGSINSSVREMAAWVSLHLARGKRDGRQLVQDATMNDLHEVRMPIPGGADEPGQVMVGYALGWLVDVFHGHRRVHHNGAIDGFYASVGFLPDDGWGYVALTNLDGAPLADLVADDLCDRVLERKVEDRSSALLARRGQQKELGEKAKQDRGKERREGTTPSRPLAEFAGEYEHPGYGVATVRLQDGALQVELHRITAPLEHWHFDVFRAGRNPADPALEDTMLQFVSGLDGEVEGLRAVVEPAVPPQTFTRLPDAELRDPTFLQKLCGEYQLGAVTATVALRGSLLTVTVPGQPTYELLPQRRRGFQLKGLSGYSVRFDLDGNGAVTGARFVQPEGVFPAKRKT